MLALGALVAFLVMHVTECAMVATTDGEARGTVASAVAAPALDVAEHEGPSENYHDCGHADGHDHDGAADDMHAAPRPSDPGTAGTASDPAPGGADWSLSSFVLFAGLGRRRRHRSTPASSCAGRQLLILVSVNRK